jgi:hypothetical protein
MVKEKKTFSFDMLSQLEAQIIGVLGVAETALSTQEVYEGILAGEAFRYFNLEKLRDPNAIAGYVQFTFLLQQNKETEARKLVKDIPLTNYNTVAKHLDFLKKHGYVNSRTVSGKKTKNQWYLTSEPRQEFEKVRPRLFKQLGEALQNFFKVA